MRVAMMMEPTVDPNKKETTGAREEELHSFELQLFAQVVVSRARNQIRASYPYGARKYSSHQNAVHVLSLFHLSTAVVRRLISCLKDHYCICEIQMGAEFLQGRTQKAA